jgi:hypothetical protein
MAITLFSGCFVNRSLIASPCVAVTPVSVTHTRPSSHAPIAPEALFVVAMA